ncbi:MAG TPA: polysaccharide pyruvyl transferase family protein, partial [Geminicoccaceae bacterium]|nr:polysaccharide pyruvyl transferase family protein [Geminicoccaceae bacterium]
RRLIALLAAVLDRQVERGIEIVFLPTYCAASEGDDRLAEAVRARMARTSAAHLLRLAEPRLYKACTGELTAFLGGRMHPLMLAAGMATPVVALAYNPKFHGLAQMIGIEDRVLDVAAFVRDGPALGLDGLLDRALSGPRFPQQTIDALIEELRRGVRALVHALPPT